MIICCNCAFSVSFSSSFCHFFLFVWICVIVCNIVNDLNEPIMIISLFTRIVVTMLHICTFVLTEIFSLYHLAQTFNEWMKISFESKYECVCVFFSSFFSITSFDFISMIVHEFTGENWIACNSKCNLTIHI